MELANVSQHSSDILANIDRKVVFFYTRCSMLVIVNVLMIGHMVMVVLIFSSFL